MGTKRHLSTRVRSIVDELQPTGRVLDLFSGVGSVASALAPYYPIITNDAMSFTTVLAKARFTAGRRSPLQVLLPQLRAEFRQQETYLQRRFRERLRAEAAAIDSGWRSTADLIHGAPHVGSDPRYGAAAIQANSAGGQPHYCLATLYFASGYFSTRQALQLDALRCAIDASTSGADRSWLLSAWLAAAATVINSPGHTAQFLKVHDEYTFTRVLRNWRRNIWWIFQERAVDIRPEGTYGWRRRNSVFNSDAIELLASRRLRNLGAVYADPPYTKDQYSRYYHLYETLYQYDFPPSTGEGRYRGSRFTTDFCLKSKVAAAFHELVDVVKSKGIPLILSYPNESLLSQTGTDLHDLLSDSFRTVKRTSIVQRHSTLGASKGHQTKPAMENLYVCTG